MQIILRLGTINGQNLKIDLNTGNVEFQHGRIHNFSNTVDINLDQNYISTANYTTRALLKDGELQLTQPNLLTLMVIGTSPFNGGGAGDAWAGASLIGRDSVIVANEANAQGTTGFTSSPMGTATFLVYLQEKELTIDADNLRRCRTRCVH